MWLITFVLHTRRAGEGLEHKTLYRRATVRETRGATWLVLVAHRQPLTHSSGRLRKGNKKWRAGISAWSTKGVIPGAEVLGAEVLGKPRRNLLASHRFRAGAYVVRGGLLVADTSSSLFLARSHRSCVRRIARSRALLRQVTRVVLQQQFPRRVPLNDATHERMSAFGVSATVGTALATNWRNNWGPLCVELWTTLTGHSWGPSIDCHCPIKLSKAWLFLDFKNIIKISYKI